MSFLADVRIAARALRRSPGFLVVAVLTLALGIGASSAIFSVVNGVLLRGLPYPEADRLVRVFTAADGDDRKYTSPPNFAALRERRDLFTDVAAFDYSTPTLVGTGDPVKLESAQVSAGFFEILGVSPLLGRTFRGDENQPGSDDVVVIGHGLWQRLFGGDPAVIGRTITLNGVTRSVVGIMPPGFGYPDDRELWTPLEYDATYDARSAENRGGNWLWTVARLRSDVSLERADAVLATVARQLEAAYPEAQRGVRFPVVGLQDATVGDARRPLLVLLGAVGVLLLIACANVAGLLLARAAARQEELAVRVALGAGRWRLMRQLLAESLLLGVVGGALGLFVAVWGTEAIVALQPEGLLRTAEVRVDGAVLAFTIGTALVASALVGLVPAVQATRGVLAGAIRAGGRGGQGTRGSQRLRSGLVVGEMALAVVLLAGAGLLVRSFLRLVAVDPGFRTAQVATFPVELPESDYDTPEQVQQFYAGLTERLAALPRVQRAAAVFRLPLVSSGIRNRMTVEGVPAAPGEDRRIEIRSATPDYFAVMDIPLREGRALTPDDRATAPRVAVLNEAAARRFFPGERALGRRVAFTGGLIGAQTFTVVGIVGDVRHYQLDRAPTPEIYFPHAQVPLSRMMVVVRSAADPAVLAPAVRAAVRALDADVPVPALRPLDELLADSVARPRFTTTLLALFAGVALALAAVGIFGLLSYTVAQRTREIGIRVALGARPEAVLAHVVVQALRLIALGLLLGLAGALALGQLLAGLLYDVQPTDPLTLTIVALVLGATGLLASVVPARRAARVEPVVALKA